MEMEHIIIKEVQETLYLYSTMLKYKASVENDAFYEGQARKVDNLKERLKSLAGTKEPAEGISYDTLANFLKEIREDRTIRGKNQAIGNLILKIIKIYANFDNLWDSLHFVFGKT